jgi:hypothetical protein
MIQLIDQRAIEFNQRERAGSDLEKSSDQGVEYEIN